MPSSAFDSSTPLAREIADLTSRRSFTAHQTVPKPSHTRVFTVSNQKGGVGKTTTTVNIAAALAHYGLRVLVIDLDPQGNASTAMGVEHHSEVPSIYDVLIDDFPLADVVQKSPEGENLFCAPSTLHLAGAEIELVSQVAREHRLRTALQDYLDGLEIPYDYVFIDCPPSLGLLTINAFVAANEVFIPIQAEYYALEGLSQLLNSISLIQKHLNPRLRLTTILLTMYDGRTNLAQQVAADVRGHFSDHVLETVIPRAVRISEAPSFGQTVITHDPTSLGAVSYLEAAGEIARRAQATPDASNDHESEGL
ncbi:MAG: ParA family protein [Mycetocola sp.]